MDDNTRNAPTRSNNTPLILWIVMVDLRRFVRRASLERAVMNEIIIISIPIVMEYTENAMSALVNPPCANENTKSPAIMGPPHPIPSRV